MEQYLPATRHHFLDYFHFNQTNPQWNYFCHHSRGLMHNDNKGVTMCTLQKQIMYMPVLFWSHFCVWLPFPETYTVAIYAMLVLSDTTKAWHFCSNYYDANKTYWAYCKKMPYSCIPFKELHFTMQLQLFFFQSNLIQTVGMNEKCLLHIDFFAASCSKLQLIICELSFSLTFSPI